MCCLFFLFFSSSHHTLRVTRLTSIEHSGNWEIIHRVPFLNSHASPRATRAFYVPQRDHENVYGSYVLLKNRSPPLPHQSEERRKRWETHELKDKYVRRRREKRIKLEKKNIEKEEKKMEHVAKKWPDVVDLSTIGGGGVVTTVPGKRGWWDRPTVVQHRHLLFVYGENHRDYVAMDASVHPIDGKMKHSGKVHVQKTTQANIRGELNAFPIRTVWYRHLPGSDQ